MSLSAMALPQEQPVTLVARLGDALRTAGVSYCQWKGHAKRHRWAAGVGDIDLLVDRQSWQEFSRVLGELGFKLAMQPREPAGVFHFYGLDEWTGRLIHVHAYTRLVIGSPWWTQYRLPLERALIDSRVNRSVFATPSPELELLVHVLRMMLRLTPLHALRKEAPRFLAGALSEVERLEEQSSREALDVALQRHLPEIDLPLFERCREALDPACPTGRRLGTRLLLGRRLAAHLCRQPAAAALRQAWHRVSPTRTPLAGGGAVIALLGGDGAGKSTCAQALVSWLNSDLATLRLHLGRPARGPLTLAFGAVLKGARALPLPRPVRAHAELLRCLGTAQDRSRLYRRAQRFAAAGGIAICERYPTRENWALAGPSEAQGIGTDATSTFADWLRRKERGHYECMTAPDLTFVLLLDGEAAVRRKPGEPADYVRRRAALTRETDWAGAGAIIVDASQPLPQVLAALKAEIWRAL